MSIASSSLMANLRDRNERFFRGIVGEREGKDAKYEATHKGMTAAMAVIVGGYAIAKVTIPETDPELLKDVMISVCTTATAGMGIAQAAIQDAFRSVNVENTATKEKPRGATRVVEVAKDNDDFDPNTSVADYLAGKQAKEIPLFSESIRQGPGQRDFARKMSKDNDTGYDR